MAYSLVTQLYIRMANVVPSDIPGLKTRAIHDEIKYYFPEQTEEQLFAKVTRPI